MKSTRRGLAAVLLCTLMILGGCGIQGTVEDSSDTETVSSELTAADTDKVQLVLAGADRIILLSRELEA